MSRVERKKAQKAEGKNKKGVVILSVVLVVILAAGAGFYFLTKDGKKTAQPAPEEPKIINPLTGTEAEALLPRPMMFSVDNDSHLARPQSGVSKADIVYEVPVEGGGSRFEMIFMENLPTKVGPLRSVRPYIIDIAREYQAVLVHNGWSQAAKAYIESGVVDALPAAYNWDYFYRTTDRRSPHNCYTDGTKIYDRAKDKGLDQEKTIEPLKFLKKGDEVAGEAATEIVVDYVATKNKYVYDEKKKAYGRYTGGEVFVDKETEKQIFADNVIIQKVGIRVLDDKGRLAIDLTAGGEGWVFTRGKVIPVTWSKDSQDSRTVFRDEEGNMVKLAPGKTFVQMVDYTVKYSWK